MVDSKDRQQTQQTHKQQLNQQGKEQGGQTAKSGAHPRQLDYSTHISDIRQATTTKYNQVFLLTNNPSKVSGLSAAGIEIMGRIPLIAPVHRGNQRYLDAKARRAGHLLDSRHECAEHAPER